MAEPWRNCKASVALVDEINRRWPKRDKTSDGTVGDAAHATRQSDHNPWVKDASGIGVVRARDVDIDGIDPVWCVEHLRQLGAARDPRLFPGGYLIFNRRITAPDFSGWHVYTGTNPHEKHFHVSFSTVPAGYDDTRPWGIYSAQEADDVPFTDEDRRMLKFVYETLSGVLKPWGGGISNKENDGKTPMEQIEGYRALQYLLRNNVEVHQALNGIRKLNKNVDEVLDLLK